MTIQLPPWHTLPAVQELQRLAAKPYDLTAPGALTASRIEQYTMHRGCFELCYACQRVSDATLQALQGLADQRQAVTQFLAMKNGAVINRIEGYASEERMVLHTASRDLFNDTPYHHKATAQAKAELAKLAALLTQLDNGTIQNRDGRPFTDLITIGIGGSDLGPRALYLALKKYGRKDRRVHFIANVDPDDAAAILAGVDLARSLVVVVSKSGTTLETLTNAQLVRRAYIQAQLVPEHHFIAVTGQGSPMDNPKHYLRSFYMYDYIGGRYSATSMVGAVMLGFGLGYDHFLEILRGANDLDRAAEEPDITKNPALLLALLGIWNRNFLNMDTVAVLPYSQALSRFAAHLQQLDMESNGKSIDRLGRQLTYHSGPIVWGEPGTNGQHAFYQLLHQGTTVVPAEFIGFRHSQYQTDLVVQNTTSQEKLLANLLAQMLALAVGKQDDNPNRRFPGNRPSSLLLADRLTPYSMGALLALYEAKVAFQGFLWGINSFDQEGVQLGKILAAGLLDHFSGLRDNPNYSGAATDPLGWKLVQNVCEECGECGE